MSERREETRIRPRMRVQHLRFGIGKVMAVSGYQVWVKFGAGSVWVNPESLKPIERKDVRK